MLIRNIMGSSFMIVLYAFIGFNCAHMYSSFDHKQDAEKSKVVHFYLLHTT